MSRMPAPPAALPDHVLLLRLCAGPEDLPGAAFGRQCSGSPAAARVAAKAEAWGLAGLLYQRIARSPILQQLFRGHRQRLRRVYLKTAADNLVRQQALGRVLEEAERRDLPVVLLKGAALLGGVYADPGLRDMTDIDLWVREPDLPKVTEILLGEGFARDRRYPTTFRSGPVSFDLHTHFLGADRIRSRTTVFGAPAAAVFSRTVPITVSGRRALGLDPFDQVLFLWLHALKHNLSFLVWLIDLHRITEEWSTESWNRFLERADGQHHGTTASQMIAVLEAVIGPCLPARCRLGREEPGVCQRYAIRRFIKNGALPKWAPFLLFAPHGDRTAQLRILIESLYPRPAVLRQVFPARSRAPIWTLYLLRTCQIMVSGLSALRKA